MNQPRASCELAEADRARAQGWTNRFTGSPLTLTLVAGAGLNDVSKGTVVGSATVTRDAVTGAIFTDVAMGAGFSVGLAKESCIVYPVTGYDFEDPIVNNYPGTLTVWTCGW